MQGAEGAEVIPTRSELAKSQILREAFRMAKGEMLDPSITDAEFEKSWKMTRKEMCSEIRDYESHCALLEVLAAMDGQIIERAHAKDYYKRQSIPMSVRRTVYERDGYKCVECGVLTGLSLDHVVPVSSGGDNSLGNLRTLCLTCNLKKGSLAGRPY